jgi:hypothetical protein
MDFQACKSKHLAALRWFDPPEFVTAILLPNWRKSANTNELNGIQNVRIPVFRSHGCGNPNNKFQVSSTNSPGRWSQNEKSEW